MLESAAVTSKNERMNQNGSDAMARNYIDGCTRPRLQVGVFPLDDDSDDIGGADGENADDDDSVVDDPTQFLVKATISNYDGEHTRRNALLLDL